MTCVQQVLFELEASYYGHPYFVTGNALFNALASRVGERARRSLCVSHGVFVPGEYGEFPAPHSQSGYAGKLGQSLPEVEAYADLFVFRDAAHRWLLSSRPRDAHNALDLESHGGRVAVAPACWFGRPPETRNHRRSMSWFLHCYLHGNGAGGDDESVLPLAEDVLDGVQVGGARNYGFGELSVADSQVVDLDALDYGAIEAAAAGEGSCRVELVTPFVLATEHPSGDAGPVPWWWGTESTGTRNGPGEGLRRRETRFVDGGDVYAVATVDHGQVVRYAGDDAVRTAKNGVTRVGTHSRFGFGELRVRPPGTDRIAERADAAPRREGGA